MIVSRLAWITSILASRGLPAFAQALVQPTVETAPVRSTGDAADDAVVWVHPTDPALSTVIGTDKHGGLSVYDLTGKELQFLPDGKLNNVDLRTGFSLGGKAVDLVTSGEESRNVLLAYAVDPDTRLLRNVTARAIELGIAIGGCCMYRSRITGETYFFGTSSHGGIEQWRLFEAGDGRVDAERVRSFEVGGKAEGCVADDETGTLFVAQEKLGIWAYGAEPDAWTTRVQVDHSGPGGHLVADVEGLTIYYASGGAGYLLASSQGNDTFVVYDRRAPYAHRLTFQVASNPSLGIDDVSHTDGIDVMNLGLGPAFPEGVLVVQDDSNPGGNQDFKLISWKEIARQADPPLVIDPDYSRGVSRSSSHVKEAGVRDESDDVTLVHLEACSGKPEGTWGEASYKVERVVKQRYRKLKLDVENAQPGVAYELSLDGCALGEVITSRRGVLELEISEEDGQSFPAGFGEPKEGSVLHVAGLMDLRFQPLEKLTDLEADIAGPGELSGKVRFKIERLGDVVTREFQLKVDGAPVGTTQAVTLDGVRVADVKIDDEGKGKLKFSTKRHASFPSPFPEPHQGSVFAVGDLVRGELVDVLAPER
jgi:myo-inositol-hexaphosphate 3-phosphohydrolase